LALDDLDARELIARTNISRFKKLLAKIDGEQMAVVRQLLKNEELALSIIVAERA
jgi:hypothetical protein